MSFIKTGESDLISVIKTKNNQDTIYIRCNNCGCLYNSLNSCSCENKQNDKEDKEDECMGKDK